MTARLTPIADALRGAIRTSGETSYAVAKTAGVAPSAISRFLSHRRSLSLDSADALASSLGLKVIEGPKRKARPA
jgi:plasmid maintenance system antidote protein VapI